MPSDTYKPNAGGSRASNVQLVYDPATQSWVPTSPTNESGQTSNPTTKTNQEVAEPSTTSKVDSKTAAQKEYIEVEFNTLTGDLTLTSTEKSIRIKVNDTIKIVGIGKYLSGLYFVTSIRRTLNKDSGYTHTLSLLKNGFGNSLKKSQEVVETRNTEVSKSSPEIKVGDSVKIVGDNATYSNADDGVKVPAWVKQKTLTIQQVSKDGTRVLLQPINSWTYISNIQKS